MTASEVSHSIATSILSLPTELHLQITSYLDPLSIYALRTQHPHLHITIPSLTPLQLLAAEESPLLSSHALGCPCCLLLLPRSRFGLPKEEIFGEYKACINCGSRPYKQWTVNPFHDDTTYRFGRAREEGSWYEMAERCWECNPWSWRELHMFTGTCDGCPELTEREERVWRLRMVKRMIEDGRVLREGVGAGSLDDEGCGKRGQRG